MTLLIREADVRRLLPMSDAIRVVRDALASQASTGGQNLPRRRVSLNHGILNVMAASVPSSQAAGLKAYAVTRAGARFLAALWDRDDGRLLALLEADWLGRIRTGAASGVATDVLSSPNAGTLAVIGTGKQAVTQIEAVSTVRRLKQVRVFSRDADRRADFARATEDRLGLAVVPAPDPRSAVDGADIVVTITSSASPVVNGEWLSDCCHVNAAGANVIDRRELSSTVLQRAETIAVDSIEQARLEAGDLAVPVAEGILNWERVQEVGTILANDEAAPGSGISVFKSLGVAIEDVAVARFVYERAVAEGRGEQSTFGEGAA